MLSVCTLTARMLSIPLLSLIIQSVDMLRVYAECSHAPCLMLRILTLSVLF
jgi:hypothetical protein